MFICDKLLIINRNPSEYNNKYFEAAVESLKSPYSKKFTNLDDAKKFQLQIGFNCGIYEVEISSTHNDIAPSNIVRLFLHPSLSDNTIVENKLYKNHIIEGSTKNPRC